MIRRFVSALVPLAFATVALAGCHRHRAADAPPPPDQPVPQPAPPPPPCDVVGVWQTTQAVPVGPQQVEIAPTDRPGVYQVKARNGTNLGVASIKTMNGATVDTQYTNPIYKCEVANTACNTMTCAFNGGAAPATFTRVQ